MHVGLLVDQERLDNERSMLDELSSGLLERDVTISLLVPETPTPPQPLPEGVREVTYTASVPPWLQRMRANQLAAQLEKKTPDVLLAIGESAWPVGLHLARSLLRPLALDVWNAGLIRSVPPRRLANVVSAYATPTEPIAEALKRRVDPELVVTVPLGVRTPDEPRTIMLDPASTISVAILGGGQDVPSYRTMLAALSRIIRDRPQTQVAIELRGPRGHDIWSEARRLDLLGHISVIRDAAPLRTLLTRCDVLVIPERYGEIRSVVLESMGNAMAIVAAADPYCDYLIDDQTAALVEQPDTELWVRQLRRVISDPDNARRLGSGARQFVLARHRTRHHVEALTHMFSRMRSGDAYSFAALQGDDR